MNFVRCLCVLLLAFSLVEADPTSEFEQTREIKASSILEANIVQGPYHQINNLVASDGYSYTFNIDSKFGTFQAGNETQLFIRLQEIEAIAKLREITSGEAFAKAAGSAATHSIEATANAIQNPVETAKGIPGGVKRKFENLGRFVKGSSEKESDSETKDEQKDSNAASDITKHVLGVTAAHRQWAQKVGVDPYSSNEILQQELQRLAKYDAAGKLGTNIVRPKIQPIETTRKVNDLVWGNDPQALRKLNEQRLESIGVDKELGNKFLNHKVLTPTDQTYILASLDALKQTEGRIELVRSALSVESEEEALLYRDSALILEQMQNKGTTITKFISNPRIAVVWSGKHLVAVLPADQLYWTEGFATALKTFTERHKANIQTSKSKELWLSGTATQKARHELASKGWTIRENLIKANEP